MTRNSEALNSFVKYCEANPSQRFWQALCNWSKFSNIYGYSGDFIFPWDDPDFTHNVKDTYNVEGLDASRNPLTNIEESGTVEL